MSCIFLLLERLATPVRGMAEIFSFGFIALRFLIDASLYKKNAKPYGLLVFVSALFPMPPASPSRRLGLCASYSAPWLSSAKLWLFRTIAFSSSSPCLLPGGSPQSLFSRAREGDIQGALQSLRIGARPLSRDGWGREMSHLAAAAGHSAFLLWSFEMGCSPRSRDIQGWTPAHHAAHRSTRSPARRSLPRIRPGPARQPGALAGPPRRPRRPLRVRLDRLGDRMRPLRGRWLRERLRRSGPRRLLRESPAALAGALRARVRSFRPSPARSARPSNSSRAGALILAASQLPLAFFRNTMPSFFGGSHGRRADFLSDSRS